jgi:WD40 repeat protein
MMLAPRHGQCFSIAALSRKVAGLFLSAPSADRKINVADKYDLLVTTVGATTAQLINIRKTIDNDGAEVYESAEQLLALPPRFVVTSFVTVQQDDIRHAILGSRGGALAIYNLHASAESDPIPVTTLLQNCHAKESITALHWKPTTTTTISSGSSGHLFSTSRDSTLAIHDLTLHPSPPSISLIHQLELPFGPNIEGLTFTPETNKNNNNNLQVWGFRGKTFVSHSLKTQQDVFTIECGGGVHRNWAFEPSEDGGTFIWTQNGSLKRVTQTEKPLRTVRAGGHGREIKAVAVSAGKFRIIATGAEDTDIKLFTYEDGSGFECLQTLRKHNTGIQHLQWSKDGRRLFSSGGSEEFYVWRVWRGVPVLGVGVVCESKHPRSMRSDLRIMGFEAREWGEDRFEVVMAYSDSSVKLWSYHCGEWVLRREGDYLTACLTDVMFVHGTEGSLSGDQHQLLTTAMDGHVAMWHCPEEKKLTWLQRRKVHQNAILDSTTTSLSDGSTLLLTAGDDNALGLSRIDDKNEISTLLIPRAHAAAVTALAVFKYGDDCFYVLSASIDQRIKVWDVRIDVTVPGVESLRVRRVQNVFTSVADVSSMALVQLEDGSTGVLVCGVGMDVWRLEDTSPPARN